MIPDAPHPAAGGVRRAVIAVVVVLALVIAVAAVLVDRAAHKYYTIAPGTAPIVSADPSCATTGANAYVLPSGKPCVRLVLPASKVHTLDGSIMMVDVLVGPTTFEDFVLDKLGLLHSFKDGSVLVPSKSILGAGGSAGQLACQDNQEMTGSTEAASVVALRQVGYTVTENDLGAQIDGVVPGTPASSAGLRCNDLVTALNATTVRTGSDLVTQLHSLAPGSTAHLTVSRFGPGGKPMSLTVTAQLEGTPAIEGQPALPHQAFLGISPPETRMTFDFPVTVTVDVGAIGGPSAGLALTLGIIDALSGGQLTGGHRIAATGTIDLQGDVGDVGGVAQKTVAVRRSGAEYFFVPPQELAVARSESGSMKVYAVTTLAQALADLQALGGHIPAGSASPSTTG